ncbi:MAG: UvrD-helicase domain-containing protein [Bacteroides sp.]|nr:UvrD-helicase domain-containing protein [Bacteroides sp.]
MKTNFIDELNESQCEAVLYNDGPSLVIAGAGSGKTRVLTYKIAYLLESGYEPWSILALTFTNKAAREMKERIAQVVGQKRARLLWMGTFHSVFSRILRGEADKLGFPSHFTIYDTADSRSLIRTLIKEMGLDEKIYRPGNVQSRISNTKNHLVAPSEYASNKEAYEADCAAGMPAIREIYSRYWQRCRQSGAMDFDDLLMNTYILFRDFPEVLERYRRQFRYILVDEYQDTNFAQHRIVLQLSQEHRHICVVGDDAQSIYSFRGADIDNILSFSHIYPEARIFKLEQNYRSTQTIVGAANSLIEKNSRQIRKEVYSRNDRGKAIEVFQAYSDVEEGDIVTNTIASMRRNNEYDYSDFVILYRTNAQSRVFEEALRKRSIPYKIYGGLSFYQRKEIKDVIAYFRMVVNPYDEEAFKRIINYPARGIGDTTVGKIATAAHANGVSLWTVLSDPLSFGVDINKGTHTKLQRFRELISSFMEDVSRKNAYELGRGIIRGSGIMADVCQDTTPENLSRKENIEELANGMSDFCSMRLEEGNPQVFLIDYLSEVSLLTDQDEDKEGDDRKVTLMTIHAAKGLEFKNVFVVGLEENLFPSAMAGGTPQGMEEERRLFYVAITRAEENCFLSYARSRYRYGKMEFSSPSRFFRDIDVEYLRLPDEEGHATAVDRYAEQFRQEMDEAYREVTGTLPPRRTERNYLERRKPTVATPAASASSRPLKRVSTLAGGNAATAGQAGLQEGQTIEHERFGIGEVVRVEGAGDNAKATICFRNAGDKQLLLRFARFKVME